MSIERVGKPVYTVLTQAEIFPYFPPVNLSGISIVNDGNDTLTVVINNGEKDITINCTLYSRAYEGDFKAIKSINVTAGSVFQIELRSVF